MGVMICFSQGGMHSPSVLFRTGGRLMFYKHLLLFIKKPQPKPYLVLKFGDNLSSRN